MARRRDTKETITLYTNDAEIELPGRFAVCPCCDGRGVRALHGIAITSDEFSEWHQDERDAYFSGGYDTTCESCQGARVVVVLDEDRCDPALLEQYRQQQEDEAEDRAMAAAERRMGA